MRIPSTFRVVHVRGQAITRIGAARRSNNIRLAVGQSRHDFLQPLAGDTKVFTGGDELPRGRLERGGWGSEQLVEAVCDEGAELSEGVAGAEFGEAVAVVRRHVAFLAAVRAASR